MEPLQFLMLVALWCGDVHPGTTAEKVDECRHHMIVDCSDASKGPLSVHAKCVHGTKLQTMKK